MQQGQRQVVVQPRRTVTVAPRSDARVEVRADRSRTAQPRRTSQSTVQPRRLPTSESFAYRGGAGQSQYPIRDYRRGSHTTYRQPYYGQGRVSRVLRYGDGYRVWLGGVQYPFYVPMRYYRADRFRPGLLLRLGGYYNNRGYYDYYDARSGGELRGTVESVDYRRDAFVIRNEATGSFVTVLARERRLDVRPGDYVEIAGDWTRSGIFQAYDVDRLDRGYYRDRDYRY